MGKIEKLLHKDRAEILGFCGRHDSIFLYGAGKVAKDMILYLEEEEIRIEGILVGNGHRNETSYCGYRVLEIDEWQCGESDGIILGISGEKQMTALQELLRAGVSRKDVYFQKIFARPVFPYNSAAVAINENRNGNFFISRNRLNEIGIRHGTDKHDRHHNYLRRYEFFLEPYRGCEMNVLELGVFHGGSLRMWEEYFEKAYIYGADIDPDCMKYENARRRIVICDLSKEESYRALRELEPMIIIDDASHMWSHQIKALCYLFPSLASGGIYIIEDLGTNFSGRYDSGYDDAPVSCYALLQEIAKVAVSGEEPVLADMRPECMPFAEEILCLGRQMDAITFIRESCIMIKK